MELRYGGGSSAHEYPIFADHDFALWRSRKLGSSALLMQRHGMDCLGSVDLAPHLSGAVSVTPQPFGRQPGNQN